MEMEIFEEGVEGEDHKKTKWLCKERQADAITALLEKRGTVYNIQQQHHPISTQDMMALVGRQNPGSQFSLKLLIGSMIVLHKCLTRFKVWTNTVQCQQCW